MSGTKINNAPAKWQVTATTIECNMVKDYVTIMVNRDWTAKCIWWAKYKKLSLEEPKRRLPHDIKKKILQCQGPYCQAVREYVDKLINEEK